MAKSRRSEEKDTILKVEEEEEQSFEELGLDPRIIRALLKKSIQKPTPIQRYAIPLILEGKDVVARAKTGSGKTFAYLLPLLQKLFSRSINTNFAFILVPTRELCHQVYKEAMCLIELCRFQLKVVQLTSSMSTSDLRMAFSGHPDILVSTPTCIHSCLSKGFLQPKAIQDSLSMLVLDEADLLLSYGYEEDLRAVTVHVPRHCQCLLMSATQSADVEKLKKLFLHNPYILTLPAVGGSKDEIIPESVHQFWISCSAPEKFLCILALLKFDLVQKKVLIFTNTIDMGYKLMLFLGKFAIKLDILNAALPQNSRLRKLEEFNAGLFDYLIVTDDSEHNGKEQDEGKKDSEGVKSKGHGKQKLDAEFGVVRGIDFKNVHTVINFEMPQTAAGYVHRIGRTGRARNTGASVSLVSPFEMEDFEELKSTIAANGSDEASFIAPFPLLTENAKESLRYRVEDVLRSATKVAVRKFRAQHLKEEILRSEKLKTYIKTNPSSRNLELLEHAKLHSKEPPTHLRHIPEYLGDPITQGVSRSRSIISRPTIRSRKSGPKGAFKRGRDPLKTLSPEVFKRVGGIKRRRHA